MQNIIGLWINHRGATIVTLTGDGEQVQRISSGLEKHVRFSGKAEQGPAEDMRDRRFRNHLNEFYQEVITRIREAESIVIFGPGEAKGELAQRLGRPAICGR